MKKLIITLLLLPIAVGAMADLLPIRDPQVQKPVETPDSKYMAGAVPEKDGIVTFTRSFRVANKSQAEIYAVINNYVKGLVAAARQDLRTRIISDDPAQGEVVAKVEEIMTFKKKFLNWDHTYFRYLISAKCEGQRVTMTITQISYYYNFDQEGSGGEEYRAEEWISDKVAINKKGNPVSTILISLPGMYPACLMSFSARVIILTGQHQETSPRKPYQTCG